MFKDQRDENHQGDWKQITPEKAEVVYGEALTTSIHHETAWSWLTVSRDRMMSLEKETASVWRMGW